MIASGFIVTNESMIKTAYEIKKYFSELVDINPEAEYDYISGCKSLKFGGIFSLDIEKLINFFFRSIFFIQEFIRKSITFN